MALAGLSLLAALWAGLLRLGWELPSPFPAFPVSHGALMVVGFLGTLIGLERAVALERGWSYGASFLAALSSLALLAGLPSHIGHLLAAAAGCFLAALFIELFRRQPSAHFITMGIGALLWVIGALLWYTSYPLHQVVPWWIGFLVLMIAGERLELSRLLGLSAWDRLKFLLANGIFLSGLLVSLATFALGVWISGIGLTALALWLLRYDMARRTIRQGGLSGFMALSLLSGYVWLGIGGILWMLFAGFFSSGFYYDAMLHSVFLGFVFSMIFAHAPIILPSITGMTMPFQSLFYAHLALLHLSLLLRVGGDLAASRAAQQWGGLLNVLAIFLFLANSVRSVLLGRARLN